MSSTSWLEIPPSSDFSLSNIPFGVFSPSSNDDRPRCGTAIGEHAVDLEILAQAGLFEPVFPQARSVFSTPTLNAFMRHPRPVWVAVRERIQRLFESTNQELSSNQALCKAALRPLKDVTMHLPATIGDYTDFYSSRAHATNVGTMFRSKDNALQPNWLHLPVGYHGRSSTICVDGTPVRRPHGQLQKEKSDPKQGSTYGPSAKLDFELEMGFFVGGEPSGGPLLSVDQAHQRIFGFCLLNDWSARDVQKWEYVPLGPFTSKNFATTISPWVVTTMALEPYVATNDVAQNDPTPLPYLRDTERKSSFDVTLQVSLQSDTMESPATICTSNLKNLYWTAAQQLVHHTVTGCTMRAGDLLGSGTISGDVPDAYGSMLELSWNWTKDVVLDGSEEVRRSLQDGDTVVMQGWAGGEGPDRIGFGSCAGKVLPALTEGEPVAVATKPERYTDFKLYGYWASSATWRVRIALEAFSIPHETIAVNLRENENQEEEYKTNVNPMGQVPVLEFKDHVKAVRLSQSVAIMEFLEQAFPSPLLLPLDPVDRAVARQMVQLVTSGIQPLQSLAYLQDLEERSNGTIKAQEEGARSIQKGLKALQNMVRQFNDNKDVDYCMGGFQPTMVDAVLVPQLHNARTTYPINNLDELFPVLVKIEEACLQHEWFSKTRPSSQPGAPPASKPDM